MAAALDIPEDEVLQIEAICLEEQQLREKKVKLLFPGGNIFK